MIRWSKLTSLIVAQSKDDDDGGDFVDGSVSVGEGSVVSTCYMLCLKLDNIHISSQSDQRNVW